MERSDRHRDVGPLGRSVSIVLCVCNDFTMTCAGKRYMMIEYVAYDLYVKYYVKAGGKKIKVTR